MVKLKTALRMCFIIFFLVSSYLIAETVFMKDGSVYKNASNILLLDSHVLFDTNHSQVSIKKGRIEKIVDSKGNVIFESQVLTALKDRTRLNQGGLIFLKNAMEIGRGYWKKNGEFKLTSGKLPNGIYKMYYDSGRLEREYSFKNNKLNGPYKISYKSGNIERKGGFQDGKEKGVSKLYYKTGELKGETTFKNGLKDGITKLYHRNGSTRTVMKFVNGQPEGMQKTYYESGNLESEVNYESGQRVGPIKQYYDSGKMKMKGFYIRGKLNGPMTVYYESGRIKKQKNFSMGRILKK